MFFFGFNVLLIGWPRMKNSFIFILLLLVKSLSYGYPAEYANTHNTLFNLPHDQLESKQWSTEDSHGGIVSVSINEGNIYGLSGEKSSTMSYYIRSRKDDYVFFYVVDNDIRMWPWMILKGKDIVSIHTAEQLKSSGTGIKDIYSRKLVMTVDNSCLFCHLDPEIIPSELPLTVSDFPEKNTSKCHFCHQEGTNDVAEEACIQCHSGNVFISLDQKLNEGLPVSEDVHASQFQQISRHPKPISCLSCHQVHSPDNIITRTNEVCLSCHAVSHGQPDSGGVAESYGNCADCHITLKDFRTKFTPKMEVLKLQMFNHDFSK